MAKEKIIQSVISFYYSSIIAHAQQETGSLEVKLLTPLPKGNNIIDEDGLLIVILYGGMILVWHRSYLHMEKEKAIHSDSVEIVAI